jgi:predicted RNA-binding protein with PIN domain
MRWLIDGYNVIRSDPALRVHEAAAGLDAGRAALLRRLTEVARDRDEAFTVVFDGVRQHAGDEPEAPGAGRIEVVFSRAPETADDVLRSLAARWRDACVVVSSDRAVETAAWRAGAIAVRVEAFLAALKRAASDPTGDEDDDEAEDDDDGPARGKRGNPHRASREQRAARRVLRRLTGF